MAPTQDASDIVVIPGRLVWAPETSDDRSDVRCIPALDLCTNELDGLSGDALYNVCHYQRSQCGRAFGPLDLASLMRFCRALQATLEVHGKDDSSPLALTTPPGNKEYRSNVAVLLGAYLLISRDCTVERVAKELGVRDADAKFACSWSRWTRDEQPRVLCVRDCWAGVHLAKQFGWIKSSFLSSDEKTEQLCEDYMHIISRYDAAWIIPGKLMVGSDPVTTVLDPDPVTFGKLVPDECKDPLATWDSTISQLSTADDQQVSISRQVSSSSVETVNKEPDAPCSPRPQEQQKDDRDFASFLADSGIGLVVRANFNDESGMMMDSYPSGTFEAFGIQQTDIQVVDKRGGLPKPEDVGQMLDHCRGLMEGEDECAVMVHCKGGFGRSVLLGCCAIMNAYDVPGSALLGWVRICRPGAVTCPEQERFLKHIRGAKDVRVYARRSGSKKSVGAMSKASTATGGRSIDVDGEGIKVSCNAGCSVM